jgi:DNA-directed RNA polymerase subunit omega
MIVEPSVTDLLKVVDDRYELVIVTSKRARQIAEGATVLTDAKDKSAVTLAAREISEGKVRKVC